MNLFFRRKPAEPPAMTLEGVLGPNSRLDEARSIRAERPDAVVVTADGRLLFSSDRTVFALDTWGDTAEIWGRFEHPVSALAASPGGLVAVGLAGGGIRIHDMAGQPLDWTIPASAGNAADCLFLSESEIALVDHGYAPGEDALAVATWDEVARGSVVAVTRDGRIRTIARDLRCPMGVCADAKGEILISELETARVFDLTGKIRRRGLPAYLGRIRKVEGGYLLAGLSRRDPLIEFLKTEKDFVAEMKATIDPRHWISPRSHPEFSHDYPIELGATRLFGEIKPWAPSFSYGLLIMLDDDLMPVGSAQSRANGRRHAISDATIWKSETIAVSRASGEILNLGLGAGR